MGPFFVKTTTVDSPILGLMVSLLPQSTNIIKHCVQDGKNTHEESRLCKKSKKIENVIIRRTDANQPRYCCNCEGK